MYWNYLYPLFYFGAVYSYLWLGFYFASWRNHFIVRLRLIFWMNICPISLHSVTNFGNLLNTIIQFPGLLPGYGIMVYSWTFLGIHGTSLFLIFGLNLMVVGNIYSNLHIIWFIHEKLLNKPAHQRIHKIYPPSNFKKRLQQITSAENVFKLYMIYVISQNLRGDTTRNIKAW